MLAWRAFPATWCMATPTTSATLSGQPQEFNYAQGLPGVDEVMEQLRVGSWVELRYGPRGAFDIRALRLDGRDLLLPEQRLQSLRGGGYVAAALLLGLAVLTAWLWRAMSPSRAGRGNADPP